MHARVGLAMERSSLLWGSVLIALLSAGMLVTVVGMLVVVGDLGCSADFIGSRCAGLVEQFAPWENIAQGLTGLLWVLPTGLGALLGVGITAGEIERRSAQVSWTLAASRTRWLLVRAVPVALALFLILTVAAGFAEMVARGRLMTDDAGFHDYQLRSLLVPARGLLAFTIGLGVGAVIGRTMPALLVAVVFSAASTYGLLVLIDAWHLAAAFFVRMDDPLLNSGIYPLVASSSAGPGPDPQGLLLIPPSEYWVWVLREGGLLTLASLGAALIALGVVQRRSP